MCNLDQNLRAHMATMTMRPIDVLHTDTTGRNGFRMARLSELAPGTTVMIISVVMSIDVTIRATDITEISRRAESGRIGTIIMAQWKALEDTIPT